MEFSSKYQLENEMEIHPGMVVDFSKRGLSVLLGIKTILKF